MSVQGTPEYTTPETTRGLGVQFLIAFSYGFTSLVLFSYFRTRWRFIYQIRTIGREDYPQLSNSFFGWIISLIKITDEQVSQYAGLDAYVFLMFFRATISLLYKLTVVSLVFIAPLHYYYSGQFGDDDNVAPIDPPNGSVDPNYDKTVQNLFGNYIWVYVVSTYIFTIICIKTMQKYSREVVCVRQRYLGHQNSITDRTLKITGIPKKLRSYDALMDYFRILFKVEPESIVLCRKWSALDRLCKRRNEVVSKLEKLWTRYIGTNDPEFIELVGQGTNEEGVGEFLKERQAKRFGRLSLFGPKIDLISHYEHKLAVLDNAIREQQEVAHTQRVTSMAFVTMRETNDCQMAAQALLSPTPHMMVSHLAPAPRDIIWFNVYLKPKFRLLYNYIVSLVVLLCSIFLVVPLTYLARFLDIDIIREHSPALADLLTSHKWLATIVTDILPAYAFVILNQIVPFFYAWLSRHQGFVSMGDVELSTIGKNFFYVFVNLFLIFTIESTFVSFSLDTAEFAKEFAYWLLRLSSFYANFIILQGIGITPLSLLQPGSVLKYIFAKVFKRRTARQVHDRFEPARINYGLMLPIPLLIFVLVLTYSIVRRWILLFGLIYFCTSYLVFKYQLLYTMVHPQHSNALLWTAILRRVYLGLGVFHLAMIGVLVLQSEYAFAATIIPLTVSLFGFWYDFENYAKPLLECLAIEAVNQKQLSSLKLDTYAHQLDIFGDTDSENDNDDDNNDEDGDSEGSDHTHDWAEMQTLEATRDESEVYVNKNLITKLEGPWIATNGKYKVIRTPTGFELHPISYESWE